MKYYQCALSALLCVATLRPADIVCQEYYSRVPYRVIRSNPDVPLASGVDVEKMMSDYLKGFELVWKRCFNIQAREYFYSCTFNNMKRRVWIKVGVHSSVPAVEEIAVNYLAGISGARQEGPFQGEKVGDSMWWSPVIWLPEPTGLKEILFTRKNVFILLISSEYEDLLALAKKIDTDIQNGSACISIVDDYAAPVIRNVQLQRTSIFPGETTKFTVYAVDPSGGNLEYHSSASRVTTDPVNVFTVTASKGDSVGERSFPVWVINERDALSLVVRTQITFYHPPR